MTTTPPPPRYRVVEQGRRLVVIDTRSGAPVAGEPAAKAVTPLGPERIAFDGRSTLVTRRFYDEKAPRRLTLDEGTTRWVEAARSLSIGAAVIGVVALIFAPWLALFAIPPAVSLLSGKGRAPVRARVTR